MTRRIEATFEVAGWDETPFDDGFKDGGEDTKLTEAVVTKKYDGDIKGTSTTKWLMAYAPDKSARYVGVERIVGTVGGAEGSIVLLHDGDFRDGVATAELRIASGTGALENSAGTGQFRADPAGSLTLELD